MRRILGHGDGRRRLVVFVGEVDLLGPFRRDGDVDDGVELAGLKRRDRAVEILHDEFAFGLHLGAQRLAEVDIEAAQRAVGIGVVEGRIGALGAELEFLVLGGGSARGESQSERKRQARNDRKDA